MIHWPMGQSALRTFNYKAPLHKLGNIGQYFMKMF